MTEENDCKKKCCNNNISEENMGLSGLNVFKFKKLHPDAVKPTLGRKGDAAYDITAIDNGTIKFDKQGQILYIEYKTGLSFQPPKGYYYRIQPRSSMCKYHLILANHVAIFDQNYRGEVLLRFKLTCQPLPLLNEEIDSVTISSIKEMFNIFEKGNKIAQMTIEKSIHMNMIEVEELDDTNRGEGRFGSSGE